RGKDPAPLDGLADGALGFGGLAPGKYVLGQLRPAADANGSYETVPDRTVTITAGALSRLTITNRLLGALTLHKVDEAGAPLAGSCFSLASPKLAGVALCDGPGSAALAPGDGLADGILILAVPGDLPKGAYTLHELHAPAGYPAAADQTVTLDPTLPAELTVVDALGGAGGGPLEVTSLELEIDSRISITKLSGMAVSGGVTTAKGRIVLTLGASGAWQGTGTLDSTTTSGAGAACPSVQVSGSGSYDWQIRSVRAGPDLAPGDFAVDMDSGPITEAPDTFSLDMCGSTSDGQINTWEGLFFDVYRSRFASLGFHVVDWQAVGGPGAWAVGGQVAEATWTGSCGTPLVVECKDRTTFRLFGRAAAAAATPGPSSDSGGSAAGASPVAGASESPGAPAVDTSPAAAAVDGSTTDCSDAGSCLLSPLALAAIIGIVGIVVGGFLIWQRFLSGAQRVTPLPYPSPDLDGTAGLDPAMETFSLDYDKTLPDAQLLDYDKTLPDAQLLDYDKTLPDAQLLDYD
ncbi:MAG TPA: hypothetical protein VLS28_03290, partial [Candidatus Sulfomarinibacteraceae bacterium]|nr:hypothetical protein [Candidatus Sulfomarinibacteraceae bacterium]